MYWENDPISLVKIARYWLHTQSAIDYFWLIKKWLVIVKNVMKWYFFSFKAIESQIIHSSKVVNLLVFGLINCVLKAVGIRTLKWSKNLYRLINASYCNYLSSSPNCRTREINVWRICSIKGLNFKEMNDYWVFSSANSLKNKGCLVKS